MPTASERLRGTISLVRGPLTALIRKTWLHPRLGELYPEFLFAMYGVTADSAPAMQRAAEISARLADKDPLANFLRDYFLEHAEEERGHERWIETDLAQFGITRTALEQRLPYPSVAALVGAQRFWMEQVHPVAYLGYLAVLEAPATNEFLKEVSARTGIPLASMSAHVLHATLDPGHVAEFDRTLDELSLTGQQQDLITISAITTVTHLERVFTDILEHFERIEHPARAQTIFSASRAVLA